MRQVIIIDGENLIQGLRTLMGKESNEGEIEQEKREKFLKLNFRKLITGVLSTDKPGQILFFGARLRRYSNTPQLTAKTEATIKFQSQLVNNLNTQGISFIKAGYLRARESAACAKCKHQGWKLLEKGVDAALAVRMVIEANEKVEIVLVSSDTDILPAARQSIKQGARLVFVGFEHMPVLATAKIAHKTRLITKELVENSWM